MIGRVISHYKILEKLGEGGMGVVYKAEDTKLHRPVALKVLPRQALITEEDKTRFAREAQAAASLSHPNIAIIFEFDEVDDPVTGGKLAFIAMEFVDGETVKEKTKDRPLPIDEAIKIAVATVEGLAEAHGKGIVHRDVKSENIMISRLGVVKIMDFGLAEIAGRSRVTKEGMTVGTAAYMSPEQVLGEKLDQRTDIWSLGVVLYEMITGRLPFSGDYEQAILYRILHEEPELITSLRSNVPMELERIVKKAIQKDRSTRYQRVDDILVDLKLFRKELDSEKAKEQRREVTVAPKKRVFPYVGVVALACLVLIGLYILLQPKPAPTAMKSIAVLPFLNMSPDKEDEYFSDGMTEELINALAKVEGLQVPARTSVFRFKGTKEDVRKIGEQLNVNTVLEGSVRRAGNKLRITSQLINVADGYHLWSETYEREMRDVFTTQDEISQSIVSALRIKLVGEQKAPLVKRYTENLEAYNLYLKGRYYWNKRGTEGLRLARQYFEQSIEKDPGYAIAYAGLADYYNLLDYYRIMPGKEAFPKAKAAATKALEIDESLAEAHTALGLTIKIYDWDWIAAEREFKRAIELNPKYPVAHQFYAEYLGQRGRPQEAIGVIKHALELDPLSLPINRGMGNVFYLARQYDEAIEQYRRTIEIDSNFADVHHRLSLAYEQKMGYEDAISEVQKAIALSKANTKYVAALGYLYAVSGKRSEAQMVLEKFKALSKREHVWPYDIAMIYVGLGEKDQAFEWLQKASEERSHDLLTLKVGPMFDSLRSDPRFTALLKKVGLER